LALKVLCVFGTRPEAIKMAPVIQALEHEPSITLRVCVTGQHRQMLDPVISLFGLRPDYDLNVMQPGQDLNHLVRAIITAVHPVLETERPDIVLVHGDTTSAMAVTLAAFHQRIKVGHVEAGLRTNDMRRPWPEEMNRRTIDGMADTLFAPTSRSRANLLAENLGSREIFVTGNTVIDALLTTVSHLSSDRNLQARISAELPPLHTGRRILLVTGHRRENFGKGFLGICKSLVALSRRDDIFIVYPVHLNPNVREPVMRLLSDQPQISLIEPTDYASFVWLMQNAYVILTDSGGVQEEAPSLGKPVLVMREVTERPEALEAGVVQLVGTHPEAIVSAVERLFDVEADYDRFARRINPYGDGRAAGRIVDALLDRPVAEFQVTGSCNRVEPGLTASLARGRHR
jgi:UDP-N-acetylglucosamine 2-epimerase (non-hydrolysing)